MTLAVMGTATQRRAAPAPPPGAPARTAWAALPPAPPARPGGLALLLTAFERGEGHAGGTAAGSEWGRSASALQPEVSGSGGGLTPVPGEGARRRVLRSLPCPTRHGTKTAEKNDSILLFYFFPPLTSQVCQRPLPAVGRVRLIPNAAFGDPLGLQRRLMS